MHLCIYVKTKFYLVFEQNLLYEKKVRQNFTNSKRICFLINIKGYGPDVLRLPDGRSEPIFVTYDFNANDFKPFLDVPKFLPRFQKHLWTPLGMI